jgi:hypothetical protein
MPLRFLQVDCSELVGLYEVVSKYLTGNRRRYFPDVGHSEVILGPDLAGIKHQLASYL